MRAPLIGAALAVLFGCASVERPDPWQAQVRGDALPKPLTSAPASAAAGRAVFADRSTGHCVLCHAVASLDVPFQGDIGPALTGIADRLTAAQLRLRIVDASVLNPSTVMPPYYRTQGLHRVAAAHDGEPVLSALEVEQLVAYLMTLRSENHGT